MRTWEPVLLSPRVLIAFHTQGQTAKIADRIAGVLTTAGVSVVTSDIDATPAPTAYDLVVVGDSIHALPQQGIAQLPGRVRQAARSNADGALPGQPHVPNSDDVHTATAHGMVQALLDETGFAPDIVAMFAGALVYTQYG